MAGTIGSVVNRANMQTLLVLHATGLVLGAVTMALSLSLVGLLLPAFPASLTQLGAILGSIILAGWAGQALADRGLPYPRRTWQVPEQWRYTLPSSVTVTAYGYLLGLGWLTATILPTYWAFLIATVLVASLPLAVSGWVAYAITRGWVASRGAHKVAAGNDHVVPSQLRAVRAMNAGLLLGGAALLLL